MTWKDKAKKAFGPNRHCQKPPVKQVRTCMHSTQCVVEAVKKGSERGPHPEGPGAQGQEDPCPSVVIAANMQCKASSKRCPPCIFLAVQHTAQKGRTLSHKGCRSWPGRPEAPFIKAGTSKCTLSRGTAWLPGRWEEREVLKGSAGPHTLAGARGRGQEDPRGSCIKARDRGVETHHQGCMLKTR